MMAAKKTAPKPKGNVFASTIVPDTGNFVYRHPKGDITLPLFSSFTARQMREFARFSKIDEADSFEGLIELLESIGGPELSEAVLELTIEQLAELMSVWSGADDTEGKG